VFHDTQTGMLLGMPRSARCVQRFDDSLNSAIHITFRTFAAFFIDAKAKRSVVESCVKNFSLRRASKINTCVSTGCNEKKEGMPRPGGSARLLSMGGIPLGAQVCRGLMCSPPGGVALYGPLL
jgi:hypothetical protein